jgi:hypothetical protein
VWWFFQQDKGVYEPVPQAPRGWYVFEGYAAARSNDKAMDPSGESSTKSRSLDVAALYFLEDAGPGGYGGYLVSGTGKDWLADSVWKMLLGYPMENVPEQDRDRLHEVGPFFDPFEPVGFGTNQLYRTDQISSYPGNSGGPYTNDVTNNYFVLPIRGTNFSIEVKGLPGFRVPIPGSIELVAGAHVALDLFYSVEPPSLIYHPINGLGLIARATNTVYRIEATNQLGLRGDWPTVTNATWTTGTNWIPSSAPTGVGSRFYRAVWLQD